MGRAQANTETSSAISANGFDRAFGTRRGLVGRDLVEREGRDERERQRVLRTRIPLVLETFTRQIAKTTQAPVVSTLDLCSSYRQRAIESIENKEEWMEEEMKVASRLAKAIAFTPEREREIVEIVALGDPCECPRLTTPAVAALGEYWRRAADSEREWLAHSAHFYDEHFPAVLRKCYRSGALNGHDIDFARLQPLTEALGAFLASSQSLNQEVYIQAAMTLQEVSTPVLASAFLSWIEAFVVRIRASESHSSEHWSLWAAYTRRANAGTVDEIFMRAYTPVIEALRWAADDHNLGASELRRYHGPRTVVGDGPRTVVSA
jgi:hypothetical protein